MMQRTLTMIATFLIVTGPAFAVLDAYVNAPDDSFAFELVESQTAGPVTAHVLRLTSQTWRGHTWEHFLTVFAPAEVRNGATSLMFIYGSNNNAPGASLRTDEARGCGIIAAQTGSIVAMLEQIPNQPLFGGLNEDEIIALTFKKYLDGEGDDWPLLLPMVKAAVRAMDAVQAYAADSLDTTVERFVVSGASKRGWTTWLTGAVDARVAGIAPMVIDTLNMPAQDGHVLRTYGEYTEATHDYTDIGIRDRFNTPEGDRLNAIVDPFAYRDALTMPKLVILGTNDQYWTVDAANLYFPELDGDKWLFYDPNSDHGLSMNVMPPLLAFYSAVLSDATLPTLDWEHAPGSGLAVRWSGEGGKARLWQATSPNRDFRNARWTSTDLEGARSVDVQVAEPDSGWTAYYVEVIFPGPTGLPYGLTTQMTVLPNTFPFPEAAQATD